MKPEIIKDKINFLIKSKSKLELKRNYLGMSNIAGCELVLYNNFFYEMKPSLKDYQNSYRGYMYESIIKGWLISIGFMVPGTEKEIVAGFDERFKGHIDGEDYKGNLIEIKSVTQAKFEKIKADGRLPFRNFCQIQAYLRYGNYDYCTVIIVSTETLDIEIMQIRDNPKILTAIHTKAISVLNAINNNIPPKCTCGKCK